MVADNVRAWLINATNAFQDSIVTNLSPYITSDLGGHSYAPTVFIVVDTFVGLAYLLMSRFLEQWNRFNLYLGGAILATAGLAFLAGSQSLFMYSSANVGYAVGWVAISIPVNALLFSTTPLRQTVIIFAFNSSPGIITAVSGSPLAQGFKNINWRWGYGFFSILLPVLGAGMGWFLYCDKKQTAASREESPPVNRNWKESVIHYLVLYDALGAVLLVTACGLLLIPFSLAKSPSDYWDVPHILGMICGGCLSFLLFLIAEYCAAHPFIPIDQLRDRTVMGACGLSFISESEWSVPPHTSNIQLHYTHGEATSPHTFRSSTTTLSQRLGTLLLYREGWKHWQPFPSALPWPSCVVSRYRSYSLSSSIASA